MSTNYTIMLPVANNLELANDCIKHLLRVSPFNIIVVDDFGKDENYVQNARLQFIHLKPESRYGLSKLWNICIKACPTQRIIMASWRPRPTPEHFEKIHKYLDDNYGMVALETLHFFARDKRLFGEMGMFDEGFLQGQFEDTDFFNRFYMNNIAMYVSNEIPEKPYPTMWSNGSINKAYFDTKWKEDGNTLIQFKEEVNISDRLLFPNEPRIEFRSFEDSILMDSNLSNYYKRYYIKEKRFDSSTNI